jgi:1-deoxy-D-xylulose-5-phosphate reductoisomerase
LTRRVIILGSTGSIGTQAIETIEHLNALARREDDRAPAAFEVVGLAGGRNAKLLAEQSRRLGVRHIAITEEANGESFGSCVVTRGEDAAEQLVRDVPCDVVIAAIVGVAGLRSTLAAVELGRTVALANKETLVAAGALVVQAAKKSGATLLPVDSEHSALWQCLIGSGTRDGGAAPPIVHGDQSTSHIRRAILTASGGPFRDWSQEQLARVTPQDALRHPTWRMGPKITIDCATLMNKSLELIEAYWLFGLREDQLGMVIHPQSLIHAIVETHEGAALAQMGVADMRVPIQFALTHPRRVPSLAPSLDFSSLSRLEFRPVDESRFPASSAWRLALGERAKTTAGAILNAANEEAVMAFLGAAGSISFAEVGRAGLEATQTLACTPVHSINDILAADRAAREFVKRRLARPASRVLN